MNLTIEGKHMMMAGSFDPSAVVAALFTGPDYAADEVSGGGYARLAVTYDAPSGGVLPADTANLPTFDIPASTTLTHGALFIGTTRIAEGAITSEAYNDAGKYTLYSADLTLSDPA